jgi:hypothetical protein
MKSRTRTLLLAWLTAAAALQLMLLGAPDSAARPGVGQRGAWSPSEAQSLLGKRIHVPDLGHRRLPVAPFAPSAYVRLDLPAARVREAPVAWHRQAIPADRAALPPARAPPALL